ncbi:MAG TPA: methylmalonyl-CoA mutase family protein [Fibrobacteraceae bacterium]|nr:methylmalonyl-CoA mutase family protein [Fibrobacteraceae bacterium]
MSQEKLLSEFPPVTTADWEAAIIKDLKGADYAKKLTWKTHEGFTVKPYYRAEDLKDLSWLLNCLPGEFPYVRGVRKLAHDWEIRSEIFESDVSKANEAALRNLSRGADAVHFSAVCRGNKIFGQNVQSQEDFDALLKGIDLKKTAVHLDFSSHAGLAYQYLCKVAGEQGALAELNGSLIYDPIQKMAASGKLGYDKAGLRKAVADLAKDVSAKTPGVRAITVQTHAYHHAGSNIVQDMAIALATGIEYMDALTEAGMSGEAAARSIGFSFSFGSNYFFEIAKVRAFRALWAGVLKDYKAEAVLPYIHGRTSLWNATMFDPNVNMLRGTTEAMSAVIGGVDALTVLPYDLVFRTPDEFSCRIARNTQLILKNESALQKLVDPAAGSYYVETLTDSLAKLALEKAKAMEAKGGIFAVLVDGCLQKEIAEIQAKKEKAVASRREVLVGSNQYPNFGEVIAQNISLPEGLPLQNVDPSHCCCKAATSTEVLPLTTRRGAEVFETMRLKTESFAKKHGAAPKVFLWTAGNLAMRLARATFVKNFYGVVGFQSIDTNGIKTAEEGIALAQKHNPDIFVLCSKDDEYLDIAKAVVGPIKKAFPKASVVVAGNPEEHIEALKATGVEDFVHVRTNVVEYLSNVQAKLGVN